MASPKLVIAGGSGFLGQQLVEWFDAQGCEVVVLTRGRPSTPGPARAVHWDGRTLGDWALELDGADALLNLAGKSVNCRYHARNRRAILASRLESTYVLGQAVRRATLPPRVWLNSSTATIYKHSLLAEMDERSGIIEATPEAKDQFSVDVATAWEHVFDEARVAATRKVALRTAMVFGVQPGTVYPLFRRLVRLGLGGAMAGGRQYVSWLHHTDFCRAIEWLIQSDGFSGPVNLAAPGPVTNRELMCTIRRASGVAFGLPPARWMLECGTFLMRSESELVIKSRRVVPGRLTSAGFEFRYPDLPVAVADLEAEIKRGKVLTQLPRLDSPMTAHPLARS